MKVTKKMMHDALVEFEKSFRWLADEVNMQSMKIMANEIEGLRKAKTVEHFYSYYFPLKARADRLVERVAEEEAKGSNPFHPVHTEMFTVFAKGLEAIEAQLFPTNSGTKH